MYNIQQYMYGSWCQSSFLTSRCTFNSELQSMSLAINDSEPTLGHVAFSTHLRAALPSGCRLYLYMFVLS